MTHRGGLRGGWGHFLLAGAALCACSDGASSAGTAAPSATTSGASAPGSSASAAPSAAAFDAKAFCEKVCKRSAECGVQKVEKLAKSGDPTDTATLEKERARRGEVEKECNTTCTQTAPSERQIERARKAEVCAAAVDCAAFDHCIYELTEEGEHE